MTQPIMTALKAFPGQNLFLRLSNGGENPTLETVTRLPEDASPVLQALFLVRLSGWAALSQATPVDPWERLRACADEAAAAWDAALLEQPLGRAELAWVDCEEARVDDASADVSDHWLWRLDLLTMTPRLSGQAEEENTTHSLCTELPLSAPDPLKDAFEAQVQRAVTEALWAGRDVGRAFSDAVYAANPAARTRAGRTRTVLTISVDINSDAPLTQQQRAGIVEETTHQMKRVWGEGALTGDALFDEAADDNVGSADEPVVTLSAGQAPAENDDAQVDAEERVAAYLFDQNGEEGKGDFSISEDDAANAGREIVGLLLGEWSVNEFAALQIATGRGG